MNLFSIYSLDSLSNYEQDKKIEFILKCLDLLAEKMGYKFEKKVTKEKGFFTKEEFDLKLVKIYQ